MITQQQVYDYLQEKGIKLGGTFDPERETYKPTFGWKFDVKFEDKKRLERMDGRYRGGYCGLNNIGLVADHSLETISQNFYHETLHANRRPLHIATIIAAPALYGILTNKNLDSPALIFGGIIATFILSNKAYKAFEEKIVRRKTKQAFANK